VVLVPDYDPTHAILLWCDCVVHHPALTGKQAEVLNQVIGELLEGHPVSDVKLKEVLGHTPLQVGGDLDPSVSSNANDSLQPRLHTGLDGVAKHAWVRAAYTTRTAAVHHSLCHGPSD